MTTHETDTAAATEAAVTDAAAAGTCPSGVRSPLITCARFQPAIELIGRRWVGAIVFILLDGPCRFNELLAKVPNISDRLLTERLRELEAVGIVTRDVQAGPPVRVVYELTEAGHDLSGVIGAISDWARKWMPAADFSATGDAKDAK